MTSARTSRATRAESGAKDEPAKTAPPQADPFDALLDSATLIERDSTRPVVDVPDKIVAYAQKLLDGELAGKRAQFPVTDQAKFDELKLMWQSAGDKTTPNSSATVTEVRAARVVDGNPVYHNKIADDVDGRELLDGAGSPVPDTDNPIMDLTGLRVSFGKRRGATKSKTTEK